MSKLRILIADDHPVFRYGMRALLGTIPDVEVVGEATTGDEAVQVAATLLPDMVLMDVHMPGLNGIEATREIMRTLPQARVLVVTMFEDDTSVFAAMRAGARGYVLKDAEQDEIVRAIHAVGHGEAIFSPAIASRVIAFFAAPYAVAPKELFPTLNDREREILALMAKGVTNDDIAQQLIVAQKTVSNYVSSILSKLHVADRAQAVIRARDAGLG
jgi:DNA-binding NarL/FixJ family response regulator